MIKAVQIAYDELFELKCALASEAGFRHIAVNFNDMKDCSEAAWEKAPEHILDILQKNRLTCVQTHLPYYDLRISAEKLDDAFEYRILKSVETGGKIGAKWNVYHPRSAITDGFRSKAAFEINKRVISGYLETADQFHTGIALENLPIFGIVPVMPFYTSDYGDLCDLHDAFHTPSVSICWDTGHANMMHFDQAEAIRFMGNRIQCTHIHNNFGKADLHLPPDQGDIPWERVIAALDDVQYMGPFTLETHSPKQDAMSLMEFAVYNFQCLETLESLSKQKGLGEI